MRLYELREEYENVLAELESVADESGSIPYDVAERLDRVEAAFEEKAEAVAMMVRTLQAQADAIKGEQQRLKHRERALTSRAEWLRNYLLDQMQRVGLEKVRGRVLDVRVTDGPFKVNIVMPEMVPERFRTIREEYDRRGILKAIKAGEPVAGVELVREPSLRIR